MGRWIRKRVSVDFGLQGSLCLRVATYWILCLCVVGGLFAGRMVFTDTPDPVWYWGLEYGMMLALSLIILPFVIVDALIYSNRFAGPMYRFRAELRRLVNGEKVRPISFRPGDFHSEMAKDFNVLIERLQAAEKDGSNVNSATPGDETPPEPASESQEEPQTVAID